MWGGGGVCARHTTETMPFSLPRKGVSLKALRKLAESTASQESCSRKETRARAFWLVRPLP